MDCLSDDEQITAGLAPRRLPWLERLASRPGCLAVSTYPPRLGWTCSVVTSPT
jgi:hypothetical protein